MATAKPKTGMEKWQAGINKASGDPKWDVYDCDIQRAVSAFNRHLSGVAGYSPLDWRLIKAMAWVETGAGDPLWKTNPMQIGMYNDPGLSALFSGKEGGELILPPDMQRQLTVSSVRAIPANNIRAAIGYLLMRLASYSTQSVPDADTKTYEITVAKHDSLDKIARNNGTTLEVLRNMNPHTQVLKPGQVLKYRKASMRKVIVGWKSADPANAGRYYNTRDPAGYATKINYALATIRKGKVMLCAQ